MTRYAYIGKLPWLEIEVHAVLFRPGCLSAGPWADAKIECVVIDCKPTLKPEEIDEVARELASANTDWVSTTGPRAELIHDAIDVMSVRIGRQGKVGDGRPMTAWFSDLLTVPEAAKLTTRPLGNCCGHMIALVVGDERAFQDAVRTLEEELASALRRHDLEKDENA